MTKNNNFWERGMLTRLSIESGISNSALAQILHRRISVSAVRARVLESCCRDLGLDIPWKDWMLNHTTEHPAFSGKPLPKVPRQRRQRKA